MLPDLDEFTAAYIIAALWSTNDESTPQGGEPMDSNYTVSDIAPKTLEKMQDDCAEFQKKFWDEINAAPRLSGEFSNLAMAGHDFWLTQNHHGGGFWDGDWPALLGERMTEASKKFGEVCLYVGDDKKIYAMGCE